MKVIFKINKEYVTIEDGEVSCTDMLLKNQVQDVITIGEPSPPQNGFYPMLIEYFDNVELIKVEEDDKDLVY
jgi:hypothetical protein